MTTTNIETLVAKARKHNSDSDALKLCWQLADALENYADALECTQADLEAVAVAGKAVHGGSSGILSGLTKLEALGKALARPGVKALLERVKDG